MNVKSLISPRNASSFWGTKASVSQVLSNLTSTRRHRYPNLKIRPTRLLALRLDRRDPEHSRRYASLFRAMAKMNNERLPLITFQKLLRQQDLSNEKKLEQIVTKTNPVVWRDRLNSLERRGWQEKDIDHWVWILSAEDGDARVSRLVSTNTPKPLFVLMVILSSGCPFRSSKSFKQIFDYIANNYLTLHEVAGQHQSSNVNANRDHRLQLSVPKFLIILRRLTMRVLSYWPQSITSVAELTRNYLMSLPPIERDENIYHKQCRIFNTALVQFSRPASREPVRHMEFNWRAQRILLSMSDSLERPLVIDKLSYRAIRKVLVAQKKSAAERAVAVRYAKSWPPYRQDFDGHDAKRTPEDDQSRSVRAGVLATEAGYPQDDYGRALDVLGGQAVDQPPTIQTRSLAPTEWSGEKAQDNFFTIWAMKVRATRNAQEAWNAFNLYSNVAPTLQVYTEMFFKLHATEIEAGQDVLPGDSREVLPVHHGNFSEYELARLTPPTTADLYQHMLSHGIKPQGMCLQHLVCNARSVEEGQQYLRDSTINADAIAHMISNTRHLHTILKRVPLLVFKSYIQLICRLHPDRRGRERLPHSELTRLHQAINLTKARLAPGTTEAATFRPAWRSICRALARPNLALTNRERVANDVEALDLFLQTSAAADKCIGLDTEIFMYLCRTVQKLAVSQLNRVDLDSAHAITQLPSFLANETNGKSRTGTLLRDAQTELQIMFKKLVAPAPRTALSVELPHFLNPITPAYLHGYIRTLACLGDYEGMTTVIEWVLDNKDFLNEEMERKGDGGRGMIAKMFCAFEAFAGPVLDPERRAELDTKMQQVAEADGSWHWPSPENIEAYVQADRRGGSQKLRECAINQAIARGLREVNE